MLADEAAFWRSEDSASPDYEVLNAVRPGMVTIPNAMLLCASSPYARKGALWDAHSKYYGVEDPEVLVWQAPSPEVVVDDFCATLKQYRITSVTGDNYAGQWPADAFAKHGIKYEKAEKPKSQLCLAVLPLINSRKVTLLDNDRMVRQFVGLERKTQWGGKDSIDHPSGGSDDVANCVAGCCSLADRSVNIWHQLVDKAFT